MRAEQVLPLELGAECRTLILGDASLSAELQGELSDFLGSGFPAPGFKIEPPEGRRRFWILIGGDGAVISRGRSSAAIVRTLRRHLEAVCATDHPTGSTPYAFRSIVSKQAAVLVDPRLLKAQPPVERQLSKRNLAIVDAPFALLKNGNSVGLPEPSTLSAEDPGHAAMVHDPLPVRGLLWRQLGNPVSSPTRGQIAHAFACAARSGSRANRLDAALELADQIPVELVNASTRNSVIDAAAMQLVKD